MAERWTIAFGRYLRTLRERRGLSLDDVESLSEAFPDPIRKAYLSKCENGRQSLAFSKSVALCRIYEVPPEVLTERIQLDMELETRKAPSIDGCTFAELTDMAKTALDEGATWRCYALTRDAIACAYTDPLRDSYCTREEQVLAAHMNCSSAAFRLGRIQFPLHEFSYIARADGTGPRYSAIALERLSQCFRRQGDLEKGRELIDEAIALAVTHDDHYALGYCYSCRAYIAATETRYEEACEFYEKAYRCYRDASLQYEKASTLTNLAQCYFDHGRTKAARRALGESQRIARDMGFPRAEALSKILLGEIDLLEERAQSAVVLLRDAAGIAERLDDRVLWFKAEFQLYKHSVRSGSRSDEKKIRDQLAKLVAWIPADVPELGEFNDLVKSLSQ